MGVFKMILVLLISQAYCNDNDYGITKSYHLVMTKQVLEPTLDAQTIILSTLFRFGVSGFFKDLFVL